MSITRIKGDIIMRKLIFICVAIFTVAGGILFLRRHGFMRYAVGRIHSEDIEDWIEDITEMLSKIKQPR